MNHHPLVVIPFHLPWDRPADYQRQTCLELSKHHVVIAYMHDDARFILKPRPYRAFPHLSSIIFYQPRYIIPFRRFAVIEQVNQVLNLIYLLWRYGKGQPAIVWIFDPVFWFYPYVRWVYPRVVSVYDCVDYHAGYLTGGLVRVIENMERKLIRCVRYFFVNSHALSRLHTPIRPPDAVVPLGFAVDDFRKSLRKVKKVSKDKPVIGYVGAIDDRIDFTLLENLIARNRARRFVLWGRVADPVALRVARLHAYPNVLIGRSNDRSRLAGVIDSFDVGIIPYRANLFGIRYAFPMKIMEYFYMGKAVVSSPIDELKQFPEFVSIAQSRKDWESTLRRLIIQPWPESRKRLQRAVALSHAWEKKIGAILTLINTRP